jgi:hypothetical protein
VLDLYRLAVSELGSFVGGAELDPGDSVSSRRRRLAVMCAGAVMLVGALMLLWA